MTRTYENWERLVGAIFKREELRDICLSTPTPSERSLAASSSSFHVVPLPSRSPSFDLSESSLVGSLFTYQQILRATDSLSDSKLIKKGRSGDFYYGVLEDGIEVIIKKIDPSFLKTEPHHYVSEIEFLLRSSHSRLVPLLGHYWENMSEKFIVYKHMPNKDLSKYLYRKIAPDGGGDSLQFSSLDWATRLKIAIGAAEGLCYLHHQCVPPIVHRGFEASSILLDGNFEVRLGSLGRICADPERVAGENRFAKFLRLSKGKADATCAHDVYCFGKVLLQIVTGRLRPDSVRDPKDPCAPLPLTNNWKELTIQIYDKELARSILDPNLTMEEDRFMEIWVVATVAVACLDPKPKRRPQMKQVLKFLRSRKISQACYAEMTRTVESFRTFLGAISPGSFR